MHNLACNCNIYTECVQNSFLDILCTVQHNYVVLNYTNYYVVLNYTNYCELFMPGMVYLIKGLFMFSQ